MTIEEASRLVLLARALEETTPPSEAEVFVLDMGQPVRIRHLAEQLIQAAGYSLRDAQNPGGDIEIRVIGLRARGNAPSEIAVAAALRDLERCAASGRARAARQLALGLVHAHDAGGDRGIAASRT